VLNGSTYGSQPFVNIPAGANRKVVTTASPHGFVFGQPLYLNSSTYTVAKADSASTSEVVGLVSRVIDNNNFEITFLGEIFGNFSSVTEGNSSLTPGSVYYLSPFTAGRITATQPSAAAQVHKAVLIATSATSGIVYPFTGGILSSPVNISSATSLGNVFNQYNQFKVGDFVRWNPTSTTLTYTGSDAITYTYTYPKGVYVKAQANTAGEAEIAGMVIATTDAANVGTSGVNGTFTLLMDGFFAGLSLPASYGSVNNGTVYFLAKDCAGTSNCLESNTVSFASNYPTNAGSVRKPLFMATTDDESAFSGYLFSYRGDEAGVQGLSADTRLEDLLVQNLGSCGSAEDLRFGVRLGTGVAGGQQVMRLPWRRPGSVDIGYSGTVVNGASLDVKGVIRGGRAQATQGGDIIVSRYPADLSNNGTYPETLNVFGSAFSSGNSVLSYGIRPVSGAAGYESTSGGGSGLGNVYRAALEVGVTGGGAYPGLALYTTAQTIASQGTAVPVNELFTVNTNGMGYSGGGLTTLTTSGNSALKLSSTSSSSAVGTSSPLWISHPKNTISLFLGDQSSTSAYTADEYNGNIRFNGAAIAWGDLSYYPNGDSGNGSFRFTRNGTTVSTTPNATVGVGGLKVVNANESTTAANFTQALTDAGINITTEYTANAYTPGIFWSTQDNNPTKPKAGIFLQETANGTSMILGTSNTYATGITSLTTISPNGDLNIGSSTDSTSTLTGALTVTGGLGVAKTIVAAGITAASLTLTGAAVGVTPTSAAHLTRKDYVDSSTRVGGTICFYMGWQTAYTPHWTGASKPANSAVITLPTGTWDGLIWSVPTAGTPVTITGVNFASGAVTASGVAAIGTYFVVQATRTA
jgi:hypothetical protein